jgi:DNA topoisomerase VI subunit B
VIGFEGCASRLVERNAGGAVGNQRRDLCRLRGSQVALLLHDVVSGRRSQAEFLLLGLLDVTNPRQQHAGIAHQEPAGLEQDAQA